MSPEPNIHLFDSIDRGRRDAGYGQSTVFCWSGHCETQGLIQLKFILRGGKEKREGYAIETSELKNELTSN